MRLINIVVFNHIQARNCPVIAITDKGGKELKKYVDKVLTVPFMSPEIAPIINAIVCQLFAYHVADIRGCPIDLNSETPYYTSALSTFESSNNPG